MIRIEASSILWIRDAAVWTVACIRALAAFISMDQHHPTKVRILRRYLSQPAFDGQMAKHRCRRSVAAQACEVIMRHVLHRQSCLSHAVMVCLIRTQRKLRPVMHGPFPTNLSLRSDEGLTVANQASVVTQSQERPASQDLLFIAAFSPMTRRCRTASGVLTTKRPQRTITPCSIGRYRACNKMALQAVA